jgi:hypothetical protein
MKRRKGEGNCTGSTSERKRQIQDPERLMKKEKLKK